MTKRFPFRTGKTKYDFQKTYEKWWLGKLVRFPHSLDAEPKRVVKIDLIGPPSFVYGDVWLTFEDGENVYIPTPPDVFKPRKKDLIVVD